MAHDLSRVSSRWLCFVCWGLRRERRLATIRIFSGIMGGGFPACAEHEREAATDAMQPLLESKQLDPQYTVKAYAVTVDEEGFPGMYGRPLWTARRKAAP